jgi:hypothetical protein
MGHVLNAKTMGAPFFRWGMFIRGIAEARGLDIADLQRLCKEHVAAPRWYRFFRGERGPTATELKHMEKRLNFNTPVEMLASEDSMGRPVKDIQLNLGKS